MHFKLYFAKTLKIKSGIYIQNEDYNFLFLPTTNFGPLLRRLSH